MNWTTGRAWLGALARLVLGAVFLWAGAEKLSSPRTVLRTVLAYDATPMWLGKAIAYGLPVLEICLGVLLVIGVLSRLVAAVIGVLLVVYSIAILEVAARGIKLACGCFGGGGITIGSTSYLLDLLRNIGLLVLAVFLVLWPVSRLSLDEFLAREDHVEMPSAKRLRSEGGLRKYQTELAKRQSNARARHRYIVTALTIIVVLVSVIGIGVQSKRVKITGDETATNGTVANGITLGVSGPVTIDVFEDFQCTKCLAFEQAAGADLTSMINGHTAQVRYHMVAILDSGSTGNRYSSRAANASVCASDISTIDFLKYHNYLFGKDGNGNLIQPKVGNHGRTDSSLITYSQDALGIGLTDLSTFQTCVQSEQHASFVLGVTDNFTKRGLVTVPTVLVNGKKLKTLTKAGLDAAVAYARAHPPKVTKPAATPSASDSAAPPSTGDSATSSATAPAASASP